ncbi:MAG: S8 family serine peptidase [Chloroflexi bacterium]|nr:S8 family serine peptidase [Chloroflexota bacterium]
MPEPRPASRRRTYRLAPLFLAVLVFATLVPQRQAAATDGFLDRPAPFPVRGGGEKGDGTAPDSQPTGRLIVRYRDGVTDAQRERIRAADRLELVSSVALPNTEIVVPAEGGVSQALAQLGRRSDVLYVEPEYRRTHMAGPTTEPLFRQQWGHHNTGQEVGGFNGAPNVDMNVPEAWEITTGDADLVVAVTDDGVDFSHSDLADRAWVNPGETAGNGIDDDGNGYVDDVNGWDFCEGDNTVFEAGDAHGTHVAGTIAASGNGAGIAGVAPSVKIMAVRFLGDDLSCGTDAQAANAIAYAHDNGARIINASWGGYGYSQTLRAAILNAPEALLVAAAGNDNLDTDLDPVYPASFDLGNILSIAAIHNEGHLTEFTNYGYESVDVSAPGEDILSTVPGGLWEHWSGTSMAAPHASGVAALAASAKPELLGNASALRAHLIATAKALPSTLFWVASPRLLDARAAVVDRPDITRLAGTNRYATAAAVSKATYVPGVPYVFIAVGTSFPDALAGGAVAAQTGSPLLLVKGTTIPSETVAELQRLKPHQIFVLGSPGVVGHAVLNALGQYDDPASEQVIRLWGNNRYETAAAVAERFSPGVPTAFIATGADFPDALAGVPATAIKGGPLLLVTNTTIPPATAVALDYLQPQRIVILGGTGVISSGVATLLDQFTGPVERMSGANRYATAADVAARVFPAAETAFVANGLGFPDALAGGPSAGAFGGPLLLVNTLAAQSSTRLQLERLQPARIFVLGGDSVVPDHVVTEIQGLFP